MYSYYITDRRHFPDRQAFLQNVARLLVEGVEMIQIRERDLSARDLTALTQEVLALTNPRGTRILINDRTDVALATKAAGVHLRGNSPSPTQIRSIAPENFLIGVSCHSVDDVRRAEQEQANFAVLAPIFATPGKGPELGLDVLAEAARSASIPIFALGGVTAERIDACRGAGAVGIAGISIFQPR